MSNTHVTAAITVLQKLQEAVSTAYLPYFVTPNALLSLGNMRTLSGIRIDSPTKEEEDVMRTATEVLNQDSHYCQPERGKLRADNQPYTGASIYSRSCMRKLSDNFLMPLPEFREDSSQEYLKNLEKKITKPKQREAHREPLDNLEVHWLAGLLFGYPEPAIAAMPPFWAYEYETREEYRKRVYEADIHHAFMYFESSDGTCIYDFPWYLAEHPDIVIHQQQWSQYLTDFYSSDWHQEVSQDAGFQETVDRNKHRDQKTNTNSTGEAQ